MNNKFNTNKFNIIATYHDKKITYEFVPHDIFHDLQVTVESSIFNSFNLIQDVPTSIPGVNKTLFKVSKDYIPTREEFNQGYIYDRTFVDVRNASEESIEIVCKTIHLKIKIC